MNFCEKYTSAIKDTVLISLNQNKNLKYWRDDMFTNTLIFVIPLSIIALIPSVLWALDFGYYQLVIIDVVSVLIIIMLGFKKGIKIKHRKLLFIGTGYVLSFTLIYYVGLNSTLYLLACCFLSVFIYSFKNEYFPALLNLYISILYILLYYFDFILANNATIKPSELFAVFSNLIFLSFLVCTLIPRLFMRLNDSFKETLRHTKKIEKQNNLLKEITWIQSHVVRTPLSRLMALTELLKNTDNSVEEKKFLLDNIIISSKELDEIIKEIVQKSESVHANE
ncbi:histidine kinase dimerization/phospho-acceptor domain-containing protein [Flavobacterium sp. W1B]|uniref:histidine kinase dimerization/phospho-acceptor domain-containing protein n=1 Tax=Flavobacterium sp. W1B TaxID=3394146 RepID=UPI0039BC9944